MPLKFKQEAEPPPPSFIDKLGGIKGILASGTRALSGVASAEGGWLGAGISGAGELGAEALEGSLFKQDIGRTLARTGAAAGLGAIPFGAVLKAGKPIASALRGAVHAGGGEAVREVAAGNDLDPSAIGTSALLGGATTGLLAKFLTPKAAVPSAAAAPIEIQTTAQTGKGTRVIDPTKGGGITENLTPLPSITPTGEVPLPVGPMPEPKASVPYSGTAPAPYRRAATDTIKAEALAAKERAAADEIAAIKLTHQPQEPTVTESGSSPTPAGKESFRRTWTPPDPKATPAHTEFEPGGGDPVIDRTADYDAQRAAQSKPVEPPPQAAPTQPVEQSPLVKLFKSPVDAVGEAARAAKTEPGINPLAQRQLGIALQTEAKKAGLPVRGTPNLAKFLESKVSPEIGAVKPGEAPPPLSSASTTSAVEPIPPPPAAEPVPPAPGTPEYDYAMRQSLKDAQNGGTSVGEPTYEDSYPGAAQEEHDFIDSLPKDPEARKSLLHRLLSEGSLGGSKGEIDPRLANFLARMAVGGAVGGVVGETQDHPYAGAALGAIGGGFTAGRGNMLPLSAEALASGKPGFDAGMQAVNKIHNASMLSPLSVLKKFMGDVGGLGAAAAENPDKAKALGKAVFGGGMKDAWQVGKEAFHAPPPEEAISGMENLANKGPLSWSGRAMAGLTAGTKNLMEQGGFTPEEAKYYTFTSTPETGVGQAALRAQRSTQLIQHLAPFARLAINRLERGLERSPIGPLMHYASEAGGDPTAGLKALRNAGYGSAAMLGAYSLTPEDYVKEHPVAASIETALAGPYGLPIAAAMAMKTNAQTPSAEAARTVAKDIPGLRLVEDLVNSPPAALRNYLSGYTNVLRPIATMIDPTEPDVTNHPWDKALSNIPGVREQLPQNLPSRLPRIGGLKFIR